MPNKHVHVEVWVHWKQGDSLYNHFKQIKKPVEAFMSWAQALHDGACDIERGMRIIEKVGVNIDDLQADTHHIGFCVTQAEYEKLQDAGLFEFGTFYKAEWPEEEDEDYDEEEEEPDEENDEEPESDEE